MMRVSIIVQVCCQSLTRPLRFHPAVKSRMGDSVSDAQTLRVHVDTDKCQGHNRCKLAAPALFVLDEYGYAREAGDGRVPADQVNQAQLARANCPEYAVSLRRVMGP